MQILTRIPDFKTSDIGRAIEAELRSGLRLKKEQEQARIRQAEAQASSMRGHKSIKGLGKCVAVIPEWDYFRMKQKYGNEVASKEFLRYYQKKFPNLAPNKI